VFSVNSFPSAGDVQSSCQVDSVLLKMDSTLLNFISLHCIKSANIVTYGKIQCEHFICPKADLSDFNVIFFPVLYVKHFFFWSSFDSLILAFP
jgi:hypothetical protein